MNAVESESQALDTERQYLTFSLGEHVLSTELGNVSEIVGYPSISHVPGSPGWVRGVFNLRGRVMPVIDLARKLSLEPVEVDKKTCVLVLKIEVDGLVIDAGVVADEVRTLVVATDSEIEPPPVFGAGFQIEYLSGMLRPSDDDEVVAIVDLVAVFERDELLAFALEEHRGREAASTTEVATESELEALLAGMESEQQLADEATVAEEEVGDPEGVHFFADEDDVAESEAA